MLQSVATETFNLPIDQTETTEYSILDYVDNIFKDKKVKDQDFYRITSNYEYPKLAPFLKSVQKPKQPEIEKKFMRKFLFKEDIYLVDDKQEKFLTISDLIQEHSSFSELNQNALKFISLIFDQTKVRKMLEKCKEGNFKLTGAINMLLMLALKRVAAKRDYSMNKLSYMNSISNRQFLPDELKSKANTFSYMANVIPANMSFEDGDEEYYIQNFWKYAKIESNTLHKKIANNHQFVRFDWSKLNFQEDENLADYYLSNIGAYSVSNRDKIDVMESYILLDLSKKKSLDLSGKTQIAVSTVSINNRLCWSFFYNGFSDDFNVIEDLKKNVLDLSEEVFK